MAMTHSLEVLRTFCVAAESINFRDAALRLAVSPQVVTRVVRELEDAVGEPLFHRSTRGVRLTTYGADLAARARPVLASVDELFRRESRSGTERIAGTVRIAAPSAVGRTFVPSCIARCVAEHPGLCIDLRLSEALSDVVAQQIDIGVRIGALRDNRFVARPVGKVGFRIVGSPALVRRTGKPASVAALMALPITALIDRNTGRPWPWELKGRPHVLPTSPTFVTDDPEAEVAAAVAGVGYSQLPDYFAGPYLRSGQLVSFFDDEAPKPWTLYVYRPQRSPVPARVRLLFDEIATAAGRLG